MGTGNCVLAPTSFSLDLSAAFFSLGTTRPGFVPDPFLDSYPGDTTSAAIELRVENMWRRVDGGYQLIDNPLVEAALAVQERLARNVGVCRGAGHHTPQADDDECCDVCGMWIGDDLERRL
jgi:hypothetical protein